MTLNHKKMKWLMTVGDSDQKKKKPLLHHIGEKFEGDNHSTNHQTLCNALEPSEEKPMEEFVDI